MAGSGVGIFKSMQAGCEAMIRLDKSFVPDEKQQALYTKRFEKYCELYPLLESYLRELNESEIA
jgi:sugar (pentulose or hexulose) kinase